MPEDAFHRGAAELVGAFALVFVGVASIVFSGQSGLVGVALAHGLVIAVMVSAVGHISGGHFNPAVTIGFLVTRRIEPVLAAVYLVAQAGGAVLAALALRVVFPAEAGQGLVAGVPVVNDAINPWQGTLMEAILTFFLVWVIFATAADPRGTFKAVAGLAIGLTITFDILAGGPLTGAAMNPARAFGPQLVEWVWTDGWVYYLGPVAGGAAAALAYDRLYLRPPRPVPVGPGTGVDEPRPGETAVS